MESCLWVGVYALGLEGLRSVWIVGLGMFELRIGVRFGLGGCAFFLHSL